MADNVNKGPDKVYPNPLNVERGLLGNQQHENSDIDGGVTAQHHTLGRGPFQAAPGRHDEYHYLYRGKGSPETVVAAPVGSLYQRTDGGAGTCLYVKESGTAKTGWVAK